MVGVQHVETIRERIVAWITPVALLPPVRGKPDSGGICDTASSGTAFDIVTPGLPEGKHEPLRCGKPEVSLQILFGGHDEVSTHLRYAGW
jgi:hypothetical protein